MKHRLLYILPLLLFTLQAYAQIYTYDANNKLTKVEYGNGVTVSYEYDVLGNRTSKTVSGVTAQSFKVTVKASPKEYGSVDGGGTYSEGTNVELNAVASVGFEFEKWSDGPTDNPRTITVTKDVSYTALFKVKEKNQEESGGEIGPGGVDLGIYDTNGDGVVNQYDLDAIIEAYLEDAPSTPSTDLDDDGEITIADISMMVAMMNDMHTGEYNGHEYVDLGLPSGTLWATCNLGATSSEESGCYYAWGETTGSCEGKTDFSWRNYKYCNGLIGEGLTKYNNYAELGYEGYTDDLETLEPSDDAATANWGGKWRMPTRDELDELRNKKYTKWSFATHNGVKGFVITSIVKGYVGNSIFLPAEGGLYDGSSFDFEGEFSIYWTSTLKLNSSVDYADSFVLRASGTHGDGFEYRCSGLSIRPVVNLGEVATGSDSDLSNGLVAYYPFNGNANDESGHGNHGTPMSSVTLTTGVNGDANGAYKFGGYDNPGHIHIQNSESLKLGKEATISVYVKPISWLSMDGWGTRVESGGPQCFLAKSHDRRGLVYHIIGENGKFRSFSSYDDAVLDSGEMPGNYLNKWTHLAYVYGNGKSRLYVDGKKVDEEGSIPDFSTMNTQDLYIGKFSDSWYPFNGVIDEVRIYNRALSDDEITQLAGEVNLNCPVAEAIDLGLPSGTKWASWNVGATKSEDYGGYYAWGETEEKDYYDWSTYTHCDGTLETCHHIGDNIAGTEYDVARMKWGDSWTMPSTDQIKELMDNCERTWTSQNGTNGMLFTGPNGNSIFLPAAGWRTYDDLIAKRENGDYWSSELNMHHEYCADGMGFDDVNNLGWTDSKLFHGGSVRAVCSPEKPNDECPVAEAIDLGLPSGTKWASWNVGASAPEEYGNCYAWGETETKEEYYFSNYVHCDGTRESCHHIGDITGTEYDVAHVKWGGSWSIPTIDQIIELVENCTTLWTQRNGVNGFQLTGPNGTTIFLPADGDDEWREYDIGSYWSSSVSPKYESNAYSLEFDKNGWTKRFWDYWTYWDDYRSLGKAVRAVISPPKRGCPDDHHPHLIDLGLPSGSKWSCCNVDAVLPEDCGGLYAWGETETKDVYDEATYKYKDAYIGYDITGTEHDVAHVKWGDPWQMPTKEQTKELFDNCKRINTTKNGVFGVYLMGPNGFSIFLRSYDHSAPYGRLPSDTYWSAALWPREQQYAMEFDGYGHNWYGQRYEGRGVRPVTKPEAPECPIAEAIDLGLPSGTLWASWNIGATKPEEYGNYYSWGEVETKGYNYEETYAYRDNDGYIHIGDDIAATKYDVAHTKWGGSWQLPSIKHIKELRKYCTQTWTQQDGVEGLLFTGPNGATIFFPAAGYYDFEIHEWSSSNDYWSSTLVPGEESNAFSLEVNSYRETSYLSYDVRYQAYPIRPVISHEGKPQECPVAEAIDLGLPSGTKWASWNIGASAPEEYGGYYAWGETEEKDVYKWITYSLCDGTEETCHDIGEDIAGTDYDVAHVKWGGTWHMPSREQFSELYAYCSKQWTQMNGVKGMLVTGPNGAEIFLPAAGYASEHYHPWEGSQGCYWSSSLYLYNRSNAYDSSFVSKYPSSGYHDRYYGYSIRPVCK